MTDSCLKPLVSSLSMATSAEHLGQPCAHKRGLELGALTGPNSHSLKDVD